MYDFKQKLAEGLEGERFFEKASTHLFTLNKVRLTAERESGIDYAAQAIKSNKMYFLEVKTDEPMVRTGNLFIETHSCVETGSDGWALKTEADYLVYIPYTRHSIIYLHGHKVREHAAGAIKSPKQHKWIDVKNSRHDGSFYTTRGYLLSMYKAFPLIHFWDDSYHMKMHAAKRAFDNIKRKN